MTTYVENDNGRIECEDCMYGACNGSYWCEAPECTCPCRGDDRPADALAAIAETIEREARPDLRDLTAERFGWRRAA